MEFRILGPFEVHGPDGPLPIGGAKRRALLAVLLLNANQVVSVDRLIDELWGEHPPATAAHTIQVYVSQLRKLLPAETLATRSPGYVLQARPEDVDLHRFEELLAGGRESLANGDAESAAEELASALALWRGDALADFSFDPFAETAIARLEELRLAALEERIEADLALGRHADLAGELDGLIRAHPLRERLRGQLMLALYRAGRQAEALEAYQETRRVLVDELGIDPSPTLQQLERQILNQDPSLQWSAREQVRLPPRPAERSILLVSTSGADVDRLLPLAQPLAASASPHELILGRLIPAEEATRLGETAAELERRRNDLQSLGVQARAAAFVASDLGPDAVRLASQQEVDLLLLDGRATGLEGETIGGALRLILEEAPCDVAVLAGDGPRAAVLDGAVLVPFGAGEHDWGALELGAWFASAVDAPLRLLGAEADEDAGRRDASRLLATASLAVQQLAGVRTEPLLVPAGEAGVLAAAEGTALVVLGLSERWRQEGVGPVRARIAERSAAPVVLVRQGARPGGLSPPEGLTRYTWSIGQEQANTV